MGVDGNGNDYPVCESVSSFGVWCKDIPFKIIEKVKEPAKRTWNDEHGDDEYIGTSGLYAESYEMKVEFGCKDVPICCCGNDILPVSDVREAVGNFIEYLRGAGMMKMYSSWTRIGRQNVRLESVSDDAHWEPGQYSLERDGEIVERKCEFLVFSVTFKVNDPITDIELK